MNWLPLAAIAFVLSVAAVMMIRRVLAGRLLDHPNDRSSHSAPTSRGGGIAFVTVFFAMVALLGPRGVSLVAGQGPIAAQHLLAVLGPLFVVGVIDDVRGLSAPVRYLVQVAAGVLAVHWFGRPDAINAIFGNVGEPWLAFGFSVFFFTACVNFYNFMDGIDGIVAGCAAIQLGVLAWYLQQPVWWLLVAALFGFLVWNWSPAKIFMGDAGSTVVGGAIAIALLGSHGVRTSVAAIAVTLPIAGDAAYTLLRRLVRRENIFQAHKSHVYQRLNQSGWSHGVVAALYMAACLAMALLVGLHGLYGAAYGTVGLVVLLILAELRIARATPS